MGHFGGAFEANKIFTGILAIPLAVPMIFGLVLARQNAKNVFLVVVGGALLSLVLNVGAWLTWEMSTLVTILFCVSLYWVGGRVCGPPAETVKDFFQQVETPLPASAIPQIDAGFKRALGKLFALSLFVAGAFFLLVSLFAIRDVGREFGIGDFDGQRCRLHGGGLLFPQASKRVAVVRHF